MCPLCNLLLAETPRRIHDFGVATLFVGEHQFFPGYCVLVAQNHVREWHHLPTQERRAFEDALAASGAALEAAYQPRKLNLAALGNQVPHLHVHLFPRLETDPAPFEPPFRLAERFDEHPTTDAIAREVAARIFANLTP